MNRRTFLTGLGRLSVVGLATAVLPATPHTKANMQRFKAEGTRPLMISSDGGRTWQPSIKLGPDVTVTGISQKGQDTLLTLLFQGHAFALRSADLITWRPPS